MDVRVIAAITAANHHLFGNPHNLSHVSGRQASEAVEASRREVALAIGANPREIIFTSGATESNNMAICGAGRHGHLISCSTEHASVLAPLAQLRNSGAEITLVPVDVYGRISPRDVLDAIRPNTQLVSLMWVNNELGTVHPIAELAAELRSRGVLFHVDAAQAFGKLPIDVQKVPIDYLTLSSPKIGGPAGLGALFVRQPGQISSLLTGGPQERGFRAGTLPTALCVGFGLAARIVREELGASLALLLQNTLYLRDALQKRVADVHYLTPEQDSAPGILNVAFEGADSGDILSLVGDELAVSAGAACASGRATPSHVLAALPISTLLRRSALRLSLGRHTQQHELETAVDVLSRAVGLLRDLRPLPHKTEPPPRLPLTKESTAP